MVESCCTELRHTASNDLFWQPLFRQEFGFVTSYENVQAGRLGWRRIYGLKWAERCVPSALCLFVRRFQLQSWHTAVCTYPGLEGVLSAKRNLGCVWPCKYSIINPHLHGDMKLLSSGPLVLNTCKSTKAICTAQEQLV